MNDDLFKHLLSSDAVLELRARIILASRGKDDPRLIADLDAALLRLWRERDIIGAAMKLVLQRIMEQNDASLRAVNMMTGEIALLRVTAAKESDS